MLGSFLNSLLLMGYLNSSNGIIDVLTYTHSILSAAKEFDFHLINKALSKIWEFKKMVMRAVVCSGTLLKYWDLSALCVSDIRIMITIHLYLIRDNISH